tara:strand:- start:335 stop:1057 length:723 start_codon:yes stop_codon:yes gene_type:complete
MIKTHKNNTVFKTKKGSKKPYGFKNPLGHLSYHDTHDDAIRAQSKWKPKFRDLVKHGIIPTGAQIWSANIVWQVLGLSTFSVQAKIIHASNGNLIGAQFDNLRDMTIFVHGKQKDATKASAKVAPGDGPVQRLDEIQKGFYEKLVQQHPPQDKTVQPAPQVVLPFAEEQELEVVVEDEFSPTSVDEVFWGALKKAAPMLSDADKCATVAFVFDKISKGLEQDSELSAKKTLINNNILGIV